jgi:hypothetical protein
MNLFFLSYIYNKDNLYFITLFPSSLFNDAVTNSDYTI